MSKANKTRQFPPVKVGNSEVRPISGIGEPTTHKPRGSRNAPQPPQATQDTKWDDCVVVVLSDTHAGHRLGLMSDTVTLYDEDEMGNPVPYTPRQTASQKFLWQLYMDNINRSVEIANGRPIIVIHNGDLTQGNKHPEQQVSTAIPNQVLIAVDNLSKWLNVPNVKAMRIVQGTQSHEFMENTSPTFVTRSLQAIAPDVDIRMLNHGLLEVGGVTIDYAHHGPGPGGRVWLSGNEARFYLRNIMLAEVMRGEKPPRLVLRGHVHTYIKETVDVGIHEGMIIITPSYCLIGDYARQAMKSPHLIGNGHVVVEIANGNITQTHKLVHVTDMRTREVLA